MVSKSGFSFRTFLDTSFGGVISEFQGPIGKCRANCDTETIITLGDDVTVESCGTLEDTLFANVVCEHVIVSIVNSGVGTVGNTDTFVIKVLSVLVGRTVPCLDTSPGRILSVSWNWVSRTDLNAYSQLEISVLSGSTNSIGIVA